MHPRTCVPDANDFVEKLKANKDKAEFAQLLALRLESDETAFDGFKVPGYIQRAIRWVIDGKEEKVDRQSARYN